MATKKQQEPMLVRAGSHYVQDGRPGGFKEEVYLDFLCTWRGRPVDVRMATDRYEHSSGISNWRTYASEAREHQEDGYGQKLTDHARSSLGESLRPLVFQWLTTDDYRESYRQAVKRTILRTLYDARPYEWATRETRAMITKHAETLRADLVAVLVGVADAFDAFSGTYRAVEDAS